MSFSYSTALSTDRDKVRFFIGDTTSGSGVKPSSANFTDEELDGLLRIGGSWQAAVALACRALASAWMNQATSLTIGPYKTTFTDRAKMYTEKAEQFEASASSMSGLWNYHGTDSDGDDIGHMFGKTQWGASPVDWTD